MTSEKLKYVTSGDAIDSVEDVQIALHAIHQQVAPSFELNAFSDL